MKRERGEQESEWERESKRDGQDEKEREMGTKDDNERKGERGTEREREWLRWEKETKVPGNGILCIYVTYLCSGICLLSTGAAIKQKKPNMGGYPVVKELQMTNIKQTHSKTLTNRLMDNKFVFEKNNFICRPPGEPQNSSVLWPRLGIYFFYSGKLLKNTFWYHSHNSSIENNAYKLKKWKKGA